MIPGMNPRQMQQAMRRLGIQQQDIDATEVIIRCPDKDIVITNPSVAKVNMMGQETYQVTGQAVEKPRSTTPEISIDDIKTVVAQTGVDEATARDAIERHSGDLAAAILELGKSD